MKLPPLNALRAFEAAARTGSFTSAAEEMGVSSAAVSQQVRKLEAYLGRKLFFRKNNRIQLSEAGRELYTNAAAALGQISGFTASLSYPAGPRPLTISALPSLVDRWVPAVVARLSGVPVRIRAEEDPVDLEGADIDVRLTYGGADYPGLWRRPLFQDSLTPMANRTANWDRDPPDFTAAPLIAVDWGPNFARTPTWSDWCDARGVPAPERADRFVPGGAIALALAEAGSGVALGQLALADAALRAGRLHRLSEITIPLPHPYVVVVTQARLRLGRTRKFLELFDKIE